MKSPVPLSIVIPCYNHGEFIRDAISSVETCPRDLYELIIVNDGSTDGSTISVMRELEAAGYHVIDQPNSGLARARNAGIEAGRGKYILPLDSDNKIRSDFTQKAVEILDEQPEIAMVHGDFQYFGEADFRCRIPPFEIKSMLRRNYIDACAVYRRSMWEACGGYDENMPVMGVEDWEFWLNAYSKGFKFQHLDMIAFDYAFRKDSMLGNIKKEENWRLSEEYLYRKYVMLLKEHYHDLERWDYHGRQLRRRPLRSILRLAASAISPRLHNKLFKIN
jgi:glycosyltransferase involved in cell wall biosynthesis